MFGISHGMALRKYVTRNYIVASDYSTFLVWAKNGKNARILSFSLLVVTLVAEPMGVCSC